MKRTAFALMAILAMTSVASASVTLGLEYVDSPATGLSRYTLTATGVGITTLSKFEIATPVYQVFGNTGWPDYFLLQSEWLGNGSATEAETRDSYVIFGDQRLPDLGEGEPGVDFVTFETVTAGGDTGMGTLNNYDDSGASPVWDAYYREWTEGPSTEEETVDLMQLVISDTLDPEDDLQLSLTLFTSTNWNSETGESDVTQYDLTWPQANPLENGDCDGDGDIDGDDFILFSSGWFGPDGADPVNATPDAEWGTGDFDEDVDVDGDDFILFSGGWFGPNGAGYEPPVGAVPEPSAIVMLILGGLCLVGYRLRK